jgi:hypothetical protein
LENFLEEVMPELSVEEEMCLAEKLGNCEN